MSNGEEIENKYGVIVEYAYITQTDQFGPIGEVKRFATELSQGKACKYLRAEKFDKYQYFSTPAAAQEYKKIIESFAHAPVKHQPGEDLAYNPEQELCVVSPVEFEILTKQHEFLKEILNQVFNGCEFDRDGNTVTVSQTYTNEKYNSILRALT